MSTPGLATIIIDSDVPATVDRVVARGSQLQADGNMAVVSSWTLACARTPCVLTLPYGDYELWFTGISDPGRTSKAYLHAASPAVVLNHTLGQQRGNPGRTAGAVLVLLGLIVGAAGSKTPAVVTAGVAFMTIGAFVFTASPSLAQMGATTQWTPAPAPERPSLGASVRFRF